MKPKTLSTRAQALILLAFGSLLLALALPTPAMPPLSARILEMKPIPPQKVERLSKEARQQYKLAMSDVDHINYDRALERFNRAVEAEPDNVYLRFMVVQLAQYMGDTRAAADAIKYYDMAAVNLKKMIDSPKLNPHEKERAQSALETIVSLRQAVTERDERRQQVGMSIAKQYAGEAFKPDKEKKAELDRKKMRTKISEIFGEKKSTTASPSEKKGSKTTEETGSNPETGTGTGTDTGAGTGTDSGAGTGAVSPTK